MQLHGDEGPAFCTAVAQRTGARVIKALGIESGADMRDIERFHTDFHLLDSRARRQRPHLGLAAGRAAPLAGAGDPGRRADARERRRRRSPPCGRGASTSPPGVEAEPGIKDPAKVEAFIAAARGAAVPT